ncbi:MAG TPA: WYL domain-containing protein [Ilumatobacter sp.]|nr:WYL domain-containing protein [Ilumatobacter sp.]
MSPRSGPRPAEDRLRRLLVMLPWLMERGEVTVAETAARFGLTEGEVVRDLEMAAMCGLPPFVDELIDVFIDEGMIWVGVPRLFTRPLRLNAVEAWELLAAGRAAMELPGADRDGPLGRGLAKLAAALGEDDTSGVRIDLDGPPLTADIAAAVHEHAELKIRYWSASSDEFTERTIAPRQVFSDRGEWYVSADDDRSGAVRTFRIDRIEAVERTGEIVAPSDQELPRPGDWFSDGTVPRATMRLGPAARWVVERYPVDEVSEPDTDGWVTARLPVASDTWLVRTMLRLGPDAEIVEPAGHRELARRAAADLLVRYRRS